MSDVTTDPLTIVADIVQGFMSLANDRVVLANQRYMAPTDSSLYVIVGMGNNRELNQKSELTSTGSEETSSVAWADVWVEVVSKNQDARTRHWEVLASIKSGAGARMQDAKAVKIIRNGPVVNLSGLEGSGVLNRFRVPLAVSYLNTKTITPDTYGHFKSAEVTHNG